MTTFVCTSTTFVNASWQSAGCPWWHVVPLFSRRYSGWPRSGWPLSTTLCYKSVTRLNIHTELLLIFHMVGSDIRKVYWKFHNDNVNSFGVMGKGDAIFHPYFLVTMSHFKFSYFLNSCPHQIEVLEQFIDFWLHFKYDFIWFIGHLIMVPTGSDASKLRTFPGLFQDQISCYKDIYGEFHNADIQNNIPHICGNFLLFSFWDTTSHLIGIYFIFWRKISQVWILV